MSSSEESMKSPKNLKRASTGGDSHTPTKRARNAKQQMYSDLRASWASYGKVTKVALPKNAVVTLNEIKPGLEYCLVEHSGPVHNPTFAIEVTLNGERFRGQGRSKKVAKHQAAEAALRSFVQFKDTCAIQATIKQRNFQQYECDYTSDDVVPAAGGFVSDDLAGEGDEDKAAKEAAEAAEDEPAAKKPGMFMDKHPVMLLNELKPGLQYEVGECGTSPSTKRFVVTVNVDPDGDPKGVVEGSGASKKLAKQACARAVLTRLYNMSFTPLVNETPENGSSDQVVPGTTVPLAEFSLPQVSECYQ